MTIKLHYHPLSTYSRRVLIGVAEKQIHHSYFDDLRQLISPQAILKTLQPSH